MQQKNKSSIPEEPILAHGIFHQITEEIEKVICADADLVIKWNALTPIQRNEWICWITIVKKEETRSHHLVRMTEDLKQGKKKPCCWPGCPHRNENARKYFKKFQES
jgi:hypothetical protein